MKITFIYNHTPNEIWSTPLSLLNEFKERESEFLKRGGKFIVPCPKFEIIGI